MSETSKPIDNRSCPHCGTALPADAPEGLCPKCVLAVGLENEAEIQAESSHPAAPSGLRGHEAPSPADLANDFPQLEILELLGQGGMGAVYKARQRGLERLVALKILTPGASSNPAFAERFTREAQALARLSHPNIVTVHESGQVKGRYYFVMEYVDGSNLRQVMETARLKPREVLTVVSRVCDALQYAHDNGIVHRDIKPENILLDKTGRVKIADFGLAKLFAHAPADFTLTGSQMALGTPHYMAPEQVESPQQVDHRADIYSLGVVFYELLTGELPLGRFAPPSKKVQVDVRLDRVVLRALEKEPDRRYQHVSEVGTEVESIQLDLEHSFRFNCPHCGSRLRARRSLVGKTQKCPGCKQDIRVPEPREGHPALRKVAPDASPGTADAGEQRPDHRRIASGKWAALAILGVAAVTAVLLASRLLLQPDKSQNASGTAANAVSGSRETPGAGPSSASNVLGPGVSSTANADHNKAAKEAPLVTPITSAVEKEARTEKDRSEIASKPSPSLEPPRAPTAQPNTSPKYSSGAPPARAPTAMEQKIAAALRTPVEIADFDQVPLSELIEYYLERTHGVPFHLDKTALENAGISPDTRITIKKEGISLDSVLKLMLSDVGLTYVVRDEVILITTP